MILRRNMWKKVDECRHSCRTPTLVLDQSTLLPLKKTAVVVFFFLFLIIEAIDDSDKVGADVVFLYGCAHS